MSSPLAAKRCQPCEGGVAPLAPADAARMVQQLDGWQLAGTAIAKTFEFADYHETMAFVNATAWISHRENHHPDLAVGYNRCRVEYTTHAIGGLSANDFICAAKIDALFSL